MRHGATKPGCGELFEPIGYRRWLHDTGAAIERRRHAEEFAVRYLHDVIAQARPGDGDGTPPARTGRAPECPARSESGRQSRQRHGIDPPEGG
ncbi:hypothetical protein OG244_35660 [Streptomyces brevispora]|uniref:hypothetical protein n=1 Tax=Streptomyces brevispora TaxID=887462 RepID=UPI002E35042F|nr:hypothetical protein [Streptomyces brevispora]